MNTWIGGQIEEQSFHHYPTIHKSNYPIIRHIHQSNNTRWTELTPLLVGQNCRSAQIKIFRIRGNGLPTGDHIKNREGRIIGIVNSEWLMDGRSELVARYILSNDITMTRDGRVVGKGDQRLTMLPKS